jgi:ribosomal protein S18 acetylase RimI-like enzyme
MNIRRGDISDVVGISKVQIDSWRETYKGLIYDEYLNSLSYEQKTERWKQFFSAGEQNDRMLVIENESKEIVGFAFYGSNVEKEYNYDADLHGVYILKAYQNQGYGSKIIKMAARELIDLGYNSLIIWALKDNNYSRFYEKMGGIKVEERPYKYGTQEVTLIGYGWEDIRTILD